jgi:hypothetical protein
MKKDILIDHLKSFQCKKKSLLKMVKISEGKTVV